ncbi:hypothetical protein BD770DRAFT_411520 [Pilaira anomala]|nr:hypothetical protein BD770DRAFT_411520 [Pilaira anomala]
MKEFKDIHTKDYLYDTDSNLIYNFTPEQVEYVHTFNQQEITEVVTVKQLNNKLKLTIQLVECCQSLEKKPILVIITNDQEKTIRVFWYSVFNKQTTEVTPTYPEIQQQISKASITQEPFNVVFMDKESSEIESCYGFVMGLVTGDTIFSLIRIAWNSFEATCLSMERIKQKENSNLGYVTSIQILPPDKGDKRMGHSDPQILLGYSQGAILVYRYRANIYATNANRLREPINLSEFTEFPEYPITCLSGIRSYHSLGMTIAFAQQKPTNNNKKYEYSRSYVKVVETHGDSTRKQRKIINPDHPDAIILQSKLLLTPYKTNELESVIQLSIVLINKKKSFELEVWHIAPNHLHQSDKFDVSQDKCFALLPGRKLRSDNLLGYFQHTPQKLAQVILEYQHNKFGSFSKRKIGSDEAKEIVHKKVKTDQEEEKEEEEEEEEEEEDTDMQDAEHTVLLKEPEAHEDISMPVETNECLDNIATEEGSTEETPQLSEHQEQPDQSTTPDMDSVTNSEQQPIDSIPESAVFIETASLTDESSPEPNQTSELKPNEPDMIEEMETITEDSSVLKDSIIQTMEDSATDFTEEPKEDSIVEEESNAVDRELHTKQVVDEPVQQQSIESNDNTMEPVEQSLIESTEDMMEPTEKTETPTESKKGPTEALQESTEIVEDLIKPAQKEPTTEPVKESIKTAEPEDPVEESNNSIQTVRIVPTEERTEDPAKMRQQELNNLYVKLNEEIENPNETDYLEGHDMNESTHVVPDEGSTELLDENQASEPTSIDMVMEDTIVQVTVDSVMNESTTTTIETTTYTEQTIEESSNGFVTETIQDENQPFDIDHKDQDLVLSNESRQSSEEASIFESSKAGNDQEVSSVHLGSTETEDNTFSSELSSDPLRQTSQVPESDMETTMAVKEEDSTSENSQINSLEELPESTTTASLLQSDDDMSAHDSEVVEEEEEEEVHLHSEATLNSEDTLHSEMTLHSEQEDEGEEEEEEEEEEEGTFMDDGDYYDASAEVSLHADSDHRYLPESTEDVESVVSDISSTQISRTIEYDTPSREESPFGNGRSLNSRDSTSVGASALSASVSRDSSPVYESENVPDYESEDVPNYESEDVPAYESEDVSVYTSDVYASDVNSPGLSYVSATPDTQSVTNTRDVTPVNGTYQDTVLSIPSSPNTRPDEDNSQEITPVNGELTATTSDTQDTVYLPTSRDTTPGHNSRDTTPAFSNQGPPLMRSISDLGRREETYYSFNSRDTSAEPSREATVEPSGEDETEAAEAAAAEAAAAAAVIDEAAAEAAALKLSEDKFTEILYQVTGETYLNNFMEQPLIPREQLDDLGISCWFNPDPRLKLILVRYCDKHELGSIVVSLCYLLKNYIDCFSQDEQNEYKTIYRKYLINYPMYNQGINVFTKEGRQELLRKEILYYRNGSSNRYNTTDQDEIKNNQIYTNYYGFGLL